MTKCKHNRINGGGQVNRTSRLYSKSDYQTDVPAEALTGMIGVGVILKVI